MAFAKIEVNATDIEYHASKAPFIKEGDAQKYVAENCGIAWSTLWNKFGKDSSLKEAYERGREQYRSSQNVEDSNYSRKLIEVSAVDVEKYASETSGKNLTEAQRYVAEKCGLGWSTLMKKFTQFSGLKEAFEKGRSTLPGNKPEVKNIAAEELPKPIGKTNEVKVLDAIKNFNCHTVTTISDFTGLDRHYVIPALQNLMRENLVVKDIPEAGGDPVYSFIKAESPKAEIKPTEEDEASWNSLSNPFPISNPEYINIGIDAGRGESFTQTFEVEMLPSEAEFHRKLDEVFEEEIKASEPAFQDEKLIVENTFIDGPEANGAGKNAIIETIQNKPQSVEAFVVSGNRHSELLEKIKPENPINTIAAKKSIETPYFSGGILGKQASYSSETIDFGEAGDIILSADLNIFKLDQESREFVMGLVTSVQKFNAKRAER